MFKAYKRYFDFEGRSNRSEYWLFVLFCVIVVIAYVAVVRTTVDTSGAPSGATMALMALGGLFGLGTFIPNLAVKVRRLHDTDKSGWLLLLAFVPLIGAVVLLVFFVLPGTKGPNKFGPDPLGAPDAEVFA